MQPMVFADGLHSTVLADNWTPLLLLLLLLLIFEPSAGVLIPSTPSSALCHTHGETRGAAGIRHAICAALSAPISC
jgi:hypothetical protein